MQARQCVEERQTALFLIAAAAMPISRLPTVSMMPSGSPVPFASFTMLPEVEDVLRLQVPALDLTTFIVCPSNAGGLRPFACIDGKIIALVLVHRKSIELTIYFVYHFHAIFTLLNSGHASSHSSTLPYPPIFG